MPNPDKIKKMQDTLIELGHQRTGVVSALRAFSPEDEDTREYYLWWISAIDGRIKMVSANLLEASE